MNIADTLLKGLGIEPEQLKGQMAEIAKEYTGFKSGFQAWMNHYNSRLDKIEAKQDEIIAILKSLPLPKQPARLLNGTDHHDHGTD